MPKSRIKKRRLSLPGLRFKKYDLLESALTHPSYRNENAKMPGLQNFDRLEFFGDAILNFVICRKLYPAFPFADEGLLSRLRSILVSRRILAKIAASMRIPKILRLGKSLRQIPDFPKTKIYADAFEAVLAAYYFDQGFEKAERLVLKLFKGYFDIKKLFRLDPNPKSTLQELVQRNWQKLPVYVSENQTHGVKTTVQVHRQLKASAAGRNRKESEEKAARLLIRKIRQVFLVRKNSSDKKLRRTF